MRLKGFTLAEVLITLGILGVVAAMTMPTLNANVQRSQVGPALQKAISVLAQANQLAMYEEDALTLNSALNLYNQDGTLATEYLAAIMARNNLGVAVPLTRTYTNYAGELNQALSEAAISFNLNNGITFFAPTQNDPSWINLWVDVNGNGKLPNVMGKDTFLLVIDPADGSVIAYGSDAYVSNVDRFNGLRNESWRNGCTQQGVPNIARTCAGAIVDNGGKVIYPW